ncbi:MAG: hypothetical protein Aurels2KO_51710 [Aureliella sp.]
MACRTGQLVVQVAAISLLSLTTLSTSYGQPAAAPHQRLRNSALSVTDALASLQVAPDFEIRCVASEPLVVDPVDAVFDEFGRIWVVEMRDYPLLRNEKNPRGRIRVLSPDAAGCYTSNVFADGLVMPTGIALWRGGAVVTLAGKVVHFPDEDRDLAADSTEVWITGLSTGNEQLRANHPTLHSDGWWYVASGLRGGTLRAGKDFKTASGHPNVELSTRDFRFHLTQGKIQVISGPSQFGLTHDSFGDRFLVSNRNPARKVQFEQNDLAGNPLAGLADFVVDVLPAGADSTVIPVTDAWTTSNLHAGQYTAACAVTISNSPALASRELPPSRAQSGNFNESVFVCEPTGSLVTRDILRRSTSDGRLRWQLESAGSTKTKEWLASSDSWFRPVNLTHTPSGGLLVVDMHRAVIEHPQWVPEELANRPDEQFGSSAGRLYEITRMCARDATRAHSTVSSIKSMKDEPLVQSLVSSNPWRHATATRLVLERAAQGSISPSIRREMLSVLQSGDEASVAAWTTIANLFCATTEKPTLAVEQLVASVERREIVAPERLAMIMRLGRTHASDAASLNRLVASQLRSPHASARLSAYLSVATLGETADAAYRSLFTDPLVVRRAINDRSEMILIAGALKNRPGELALSILTSLERQNGPGRIDTDWIASVLDRLIGNSKRNDPAQLPLLLPVAKRLIASDEPPLQRIGIEALIAVQRIDGNMFKIENSTLATIRTIAKGASGSPVLRGQAIELLSYSPENSIELFRRLTQDSQWQVVVAAWQALSRSGDTDYAVDLASEFTSADVRARAALIRLIGKSATACDALIALLDEGTVDARSLGSNALRQLSAAQSGIRAKQFLAHLNRITNTDRAKVVAELRSCLALKPDPTRGKQHFAKHCAGCHQIDGIGRNIGPDISDSRTQTPEGLLTAILDPNRAVDNNYFRYNILTGDGEAYEGILFSEDADRIVLMAADGKRVEVLRSDIDIKKLSRLSLMPDGFENQLSPQQLADLISYIKNWRYLAAPHQRRSSSCAVQASRLHRVAALIVSSS